MATNRIAGYDDEFIDSLCEALEINPSLTKRIIIDIDVDKPITVYTEGYASTRIFDVVWNIKGASIVTGSDSTIAREDIGDETVDKVD